jgi:parvulin-like peptidyl-prolyl isomerase
MSLRRKSLLISGAAAIVSLAGLTMFAQKEPASKPSTKPAAQAGTKASAAEPSDKIAATVNGEPIYESELMGALPDDAFQGQLEDMKEDKLKRLVEETIEVQFLKDRKITVSEDQLKQGMKDFEKMVRTPGCPCCGGGYASLEQFMKVNAFTETELRRRITCDLGLRLYVDQLTKEKASPQALAEAAKKQRTQIEADYVEGYAISFRFMEDRSYFGNEKAVEAQKERLANDALRRLKKGDSFEKVAKEMSEDRAWAPKGGALGCVHPDFLGPEVDQVFRKLEPGTYSPVVKTTWGYCIVMRKKLTEEDILSVVKDQADTLAQDQVLEEFKAAGERAKIQYGPPAASAPAPVRGGGRPS